MPQFRHLLSRRFFIPVTAALFWQLGAVAMLKAEPEFGPAPKIELTDSAAKPFSSEALKGKWWIANFFFSRCSGPCPIQAAHLQSLQSRFESDNLHFVSISADPEHDTPEVLAAYAAEQKADTSRWHFLTGSEKTIIDLMNEGFALGSGSEPIYHSSRFILVDPEGIIRGYYRGTEAEEVAKLSAVLKQKL